MRTTRTGLCVATEPRWCAWWRSHGATSDGCGKWGVGLGSDEASGASVEDGTVLVVLRAVVLVVVGVRVAAGRFRLRVVKVLFVERSDTLSTQGRVLLWIIRRQRTHDGQTIRVAAKLVNSEALVGAGDGTARLRC